MKKLAILFFLLLVCNGAYAKNYTISTENAVMESVQTEQKQQKAIKIKVSGGFNNNRGYAKIKVNNNRSIRINTPKLSDNAVLKLVNIVF